MKKLKSPVYLSFLAGAGLLFLGLAAALGGFLYGHEHWLYIAGVAIGIVGRCYLLSPVVCYHRPPLRREAAKLAEAGKRMNIS